MSSLLKVFFVNNFFMKKSYFSFIFDFLFYTFIIFLITFIWVRMIVHNNALIWVYSVSITFLISMILFIILKKKIYNFSVSKKETIQKQKILNSLIFEQRTNILNFLLKFFYDYDKKKHKDYLLITNKTTNEKYLVFEDFSLSSLELDKIVDFVKISQKEKVNKLYIFCSSFSSSANNFCKNLKTVKIKLVNFDNFYSNYVKKQNIFPEFEERYIEKSRYSFKELLSIAFNKNKTKQYFFTGIIFLPSCSPFLPVFTTRTSAEKKRVF